jgi:hypothetical protein
MSLGNSTETDILNLLFNKTALPWDANTNLYLSLHTGDPGEAGTQLSGPEANYTGYARVTVARGVGGFTVSGDTVSNTALVQFPQCTGGSNLISHVAIGTAASGAGQILASGALNSSLTVTNLIQPQFSAAALQLTIT